MNEVLKKEDSAYAGGFRKPEEAIRLISERMLTHRPRVELSLHPYFKQEHMALRPISQMAELNLDGTSQHYRCHGLRPLASVLPIIFLLHRR